MAAGAYASGEHRGGTLVWTGPGFDFDVLDPASSTLPMYGNLIRLAYDGLVTQRLTSGRGSLAVVPDLASNVPGPSDGGRTYVFTIRPDIRYSSGAIVKPSDFVRGDRTLTAPRHRRWRRSSRTIVGAPSCMTARSTGVRSQRWGGARTTPTVGSPSASTKPDPEFLDKLTNYVYPRPVGFSAGTELDGPLPSTGPYQVASGGPRVRHADAQPVLPAVVGSGPAGGLPGRHRATAGTSRSRPASRTCSAASRTASYTDQPLPVSVTSRPGMIKHLRTWPRCSTSFLTSRGRRSTTSGSGRP